MTKADPRMQDTSHFLTRVSDLAPRKVPQRPGAYVRISEDPLGLERGVQRQELDTDALRGRVGWGEFGDHVYRENDTSAFRKRRVRQPDGTTVMRVVRPEFERMLKDLQAGVIDGVIVYDLDRLVRQPRDLEDLIDIIEDRKVPVQGVTGQIDLMTSNGRAMARVLVTMALKSSEDTSRRVARAALADAQAGTLVRGGPRRFGWEKDGVSVVPSEAAIIREMRDRVLHGERVGTLVLDLQDRGISTVTGKVWSRTALNKVLRSPRLAGIRAYQGSQHDRRPSENEWWLRVVRIDGEYVTGQWTPIMTVDEWEELQRALDDNQSNSNRATVGNPNNQRRGKFARKHLLSGMARCGRCGSPMIGKAHGGLHSYSCRPRDLGGCNRISRNMSKLDDHVISAAVARLKATKGNTVTFREQPTEAPADEAALTQLEDKRERLRAAWTNGVIGDDDFFSTMKMITDEIDAARQRSLAHTRKQPGRSRRVMIDELASDAIPNDKKRAVLDDLIEAVIVKPSSRGPHFNPDDLVILWWDRKGREDGSDPLKALG